MNIVELRKEFSVFVVDSDVVSSRSLVDELKTAGYSDSKFFPTLESALAIASEEPPHLLLLEIGRFTSVASESFLSSIQSQSPETRVILIIPETMSLTAIQLVARGLAYDWIRSPFLSGLEVVQKVDRASSQLYYQFETEQIREYFESKADRGSEVKAAESESISSSGTETSGALNRIVTFAEKLSATKDLDQANQIFLEELSRVSGEVPSVYFKYIPSHMSLLFSQAAWLSNDTFRGLGVDMKNEDPYKVARMLENPKSMAPLKELVREVFKQEKFAAFPLKNEGPSEVETVGVFVIFSDVDPSQGELLCVRRIFELAYKRNLTLKEKHTLDTKDTLTGVYNRRHFIKLLDDEVARCRRILMPLSLLMIDIDGFGELNSKLGMQQADSVLKAVAAILQKTARTNDIIARVGPDEFVALLPHTSGKGGAIKAERLRIIINSTKIPLLESMGVGPLTVSIGVSEYPSFCGDADGLMNSADEALHEVKKSGGNKVCLASAPAGFKMDFTPREPVASPKLTKGEGH